jgi:DDB1- and CUL4-associated factor 10
MICSPFGNGIRLLSFSKDCEEIPYALLPESKPQNARILYDGLCDPIVKHSDLVVSTKFHPKAPICVSGET